MYFLKRGELIRDFAEHSYQQGAVECVGWKLSFAKPCQKEVDIGQPGF